jgi:DNA-binding CsgD family transcriptional regulator
MTAARSAHAGSHDEEALDLYREALALASTPEHERDARWGELVCTAALERPEAHSLLDVLRTTVDTTDVRDQVRLADKQLLVGLRFGVIRHLAESRAATELVDRTDDPFVRCSFRTVHGWALALSAHYDEALFIVRRARDDALLTSLGLSTQAIVDPIATLSPREREVHALVCEGLSNAEIGRRLFIAESTVKAHTHRLYEKLGVHSRTALLLNAAQRTYAIPSETLPSSGADDDSTTAPNSEPLA